MREDLLTRIILCMKFPSVAKKNCYKFNDWGGSIKFEKLKKYIFLNLQFLKYMVQVGSKINK
jgi:hypothetical protein